MALAWNGITLQAGMQVKIKNYANCPWNWNVRMMQFAGKVVTIREVSPADRQYCFCVDEDDRKASGYDTFDHWFFWVGNIDEIIADGTIHIELDD